MFGQRLLGQSLKVQIECSPYRQATPVHLLGTILLLKLGNDHIDQVRSQDDLTLSWLDDQDGMPGFVCLFNGDEPGLDHLAQHVSLAQLGSLHVLTGVVGTWCLR